jgi:rare lipoprotein A
MDMRAMVTVLMAAVLCSALPAQAEAERTTNASWYGKHWAGRKTASGERFNPNHMTAASKHLPMGTRILVTNGDRHVVVRINDRGPYVRGRGLDLAEAAARQLGMRQRGVVRVRYRIID